MAKMTRKSMAITTIYLGWAMGWLSGFGTAYYGWLPSVFFGIAGRSVSTILRQFPFAFSEQPPVCTPPATTSS